MAIPYVGSHPSLYQARKAVLPKLEAIVSSTAILAPSHVDLQQKLGRDWCSLDDETWELGFKENPKFLAKKEFRVSLRDGNCNECGEGRNCTVNALWKDTDSNSTSNSRKSNKISTAARKEMDMSLLSQVRATGHRRSAYRKKKGGGQGGRNDNVLFNGLTVARSLRALNRRKKNREAPLGLHDLDRFAF